MKTFTSFQSDFSPSRMLSSLSLEPLKLETKTPTLHPPINSDKYMAKLPSRLEGVNIVSCETIATLLKGGFPNLFDKIIIADCRFPYEYAGGHIAVEGVVSQNISQPDGVAEFMTQGPGGDRTAIIFHCEFSRLRGPKVACRLRNLDWAMNSSKWPDARQLRYPEVYVMEGGYKAFFTSYPELCSHQGYVPMIDKQYSKQLRQHFRCLRRKNKSSLGRLSGRHRVSSEMIPAICFSPCSEPFVEKQLSEDDGIPFPASALLPPTFVSPPFRRMSKKRTRLFV